MCGMMDNDDDDDTSADDEMPATGHRHMHHGK
jgi:hypothetical protein